MEVSDATKDNPKLVPLVQVDHDRGCGDENSSLEVPQGKYYHEYAKEDLC